MPINAETMYKKIILSILLGLLGAAIFAFNFESTLLDYEFEPVKQEKLYEKEWKSIAAKIDSGLPKSALKIVDVILSKSIKEQQHAQIIKALDLKLTLTKQTLDGNHYDYALKYLQKLDSSLVFPSKDFAQLMLTNLLAEYYNNNSWRMSRNTNAGEVSSDYKEWNRQNFVDTIVALHLKILKNESQLQHLSANSLDSIEKSMLHANPSLFDIVVRKMLTTQEKLKNNSPASSYDLSAENLRILFSSDASFINIALPEDAEKNYFDLYLYQKLEKFHSDKKPQSAYVNVMLLRMEYVNTHFEIENKKAIYLDELTYISYAYQNNYFLDEVFIKIAKQYIEAGNTEKHSSNYIYALSNLKTAQEEADKHKKYTIANIEISHLRERILAPYVSLICEKTVLPNKNFLAKVSFKNLQNSAKEHFMYVKIYKHDIHSLKKYSKVQDTGIDTAWFKKCTTQKIKLFNKHDYNEYSTFIELPALASGYYSVFYSSDENFSKEYKENRVGHSFIGVNSIAASIAQTGNGKVEIKIKNSETGLPLANAKINTYYFREYSNQEKIKNSYVSDSAGIISVQATDYYNFAFTAEANGEKVFFLDYFSFYDQNNTEYTINKIFTDRAIYRPGQKVFYKVISTSQSQQPFSNKPTVSLQHKSIRIILNDANYQKVTDTVLSTNEFGSCSGSFVLPEGKMNGRWTLQSENSTCNIQVEEYKRPKFEVILNAPKGEFKLNDSVVVTGKAMALSGAAISNATVKINVTRTKQNYYSRYWWRMPENEESTAINQKEVKTNDKGEFTYTFYALAPKKREDAFFNFEISATVTDLTGETRNDKTSVSIGDKALQINLAIGENVEKNTSLSFALNSSNLQGEFTAAQGSYEIEAIKSENKISRKNMWGAIDTLLISENEFYAKYPLEKIIYNNPEKEIPGNIVLKGNFNTAENKQMDLSALKNLAAGKYKIKLKSKDKYNTPVESEQVFLLFDKTASAPAINTDHWFTVLKDKGEPGEKAAFVLASSFENARYTVTLVNDNKREWVKNVTLNNSQQLFEIPITEAHRGGISLLISMTKNNRTYEERIEIKVPYSNKRLNVKFETFRDKLAPGQKEKWKLILTGPDATKVSAEMLACMYDAALDELSSYTNPNWEDHLIEERYQYSSLFINNLHREFIENSHFGSADVSTYSYSYTWNSGLNGFATYGSFSVGNKKGVGAKFYAKAELKANKNMVACVAGLDSESDENVKVKEKIKFTVPDPSEDGIDDAPEKQSKNTDQPLRKNFNETAFFYPHLRTNEKGEIIIEFTLPESLTRWKFKTWSHTQNMLSAFTDKDVVAQKDLMITSFAPRFFRASDEICFSAKIDNISDEAINTSAHLELLNAKTMQPIKIKNEDLKISVAAKSSQKAEWTFTVPEDADAIVCRLSATSDNFKDGEEIIIPVLKNKMLVRETMPITIYSGENETFSFTRMKEMKSSTLNNHRYTVEFTANPAWSAVQSMPYLMEFPHECAEQTFSRVFANAITRHIMNSSPKIKAIYAEWEKTSGSEDALLSALDKNPELKSVLLKETPWVNEAQNETEAKHRLAKLFAGNELNRNISSAVKKLMELENTGWSWFGRGHSSFYITEHIVGGFGHLSKLNVSEELFKEFPGLKNKVENGVEFLDREINKWYQHEKDIKYKTTPTYSSEVVHYIYSRSFYPTKSKYPAAFNFYKANLKENWLNYNLQNQAMIALAFYRMGDTEFASAILKSLKERSFYSKEMGMYWKENGSSYYWWSAPIETQSILIEAFAEIANDKESVDRMRLWLLRNKQTNSWNSTKSTALACYALLLQGSDWLSTDNALSVEIGGKALVISAQAINDIDPYTAQSEAGTGYVKTNWNDQQISPKLSEIKVSNKGASVAFGAAHWEYFEQMDKISDANNTPLKIKKELYRVNGTTIEKLSADSKIHIGDKIRVKLFISSDRQMEFIHLRDMRASAMEPTDVISEYHYMDGAWYYQSAKDASMDFFFDQISKGEHVIQYDMNVTHKGKFSNGISTIQCMYAPEFSAHSAGINIVVEQ